MSEHGIPRHPPRRVLSIRGGGPVRGHHAWLQRFPHGRSPITLRKSNGTLDDFWLIDFPAPLAWPECEPAHADRIQAERDYDHGRFEA